MNIDLIIKQMNLEEKAGLCSGADSWHTKDVQRLNVPAVMVSDGPHGLRKQADKGDHMGFNESMEAVCFPSGAGISRKDILDAVKDLQGKDRKDMTY